MSNKCRPEFSTHLFPSGSPSWCGTSDFHGWFLSTLRKYINICSRLIDEYSSSGHKFGLSYVGVGFVIWRDQDHLPKDLIFELHYLGSVEYSFSLNFSRPAAPIIAQYFNFLHLGFEGYRAIGLDDMKNARMLSRALEKSGYYTVLSDVHRHRKVNSPELVEIVDADVEVS
jgi:glutamate/tyrosine decarboxylase-like PLP-dependent enzyme